MLLNVQHLSKSFGGLMALNDVSFQIEAGEIIGLIGPNGSGKSTVFNVITGFLRSDSGLITFQNEDITRRPPHEISGLGMARTFQLAKPFLHLTTLENVMAGCLFGHEPALTRPQATADARQILTLIGLAAKEEAKVRDLTIMERKWLEFGRALATKPKLLLLDEFMAGLNAVEIQKAIHLISDLQAKGMTIVVVEHIIKAVTDLCGRIIVLNAGQKIAEGSPAEIVANSQVIEAYLGSAYAKA